MMFTPIQIENKNLFGTEWLFLGNCSTEDFGIINQAAQQIRQSLSDKMVLEYEKRLQANSISRSIEFPPEYHQAGLNILNYFGTIIRQRYPEIPVTVRIEQENLTVRMSVETSEGHRETVERTLEAYGLVVTGSMAPEELLEDPYQVMALKHKLEMANLELRHTRDLLQFAQADIADLRQLMGRFLQRDQQTTAILQALLATLTQQHDVAFQQAVTALKAAVERGITPNDERAVKEALTTIQEKEPGVFLQMVDLLAKGTITGASGRLLYDWLMHISAMLR